MLSQVTHAADGGDLVELTKHSTLTVHDRSELTSPERFDCNFNISFFGSRGLADEFVAKLQSPNANTEMGLALATLMQENITTDGNTTLGKTSTVEGCGKHPSIKPVH